MEHLRMPVIFSKTRKKSCSGSPVGCGFVVRFLYVRCYVLLARKGSFPENVPAQVPETKKAMKSAKKASENLEVRKFHLSLHSQSGNNGLQRLKEIREYSSAGSEHLPYKQRVRGSNPCAPTKKTPLTAMRVVFLFRGGHSSVGLERLLDRQEVCGSNPHVPTSKSDIYNNIINGFIFQGTQFRHSVSNLFLVGCTFSNASDGL